MFLDDDSAYREYRIRGDLGIAFCFGGGGLLFVLSCVLHRAVSARWIQCTRAKVAAQSKSAPQQNFAAQLNFAAQPRFAAQCSVAAW